MKETKQQNYKGECGPIQDILKGDTTTAEKGQGGGGSSLGSFTYTEKRKKIAKKILHIYDEFKKLKL